MATSHKGSSSNRKPRSVSKGRYAKLQADYNAELNNYNSCEQRINELEIILKNRAIVTVDKKGKEVTVKLNSAQLSDYSKEYWDKKQELLNSENRLKRLGSSFKNAARKTKTATKSKIAQQREKMRLASEGRQNMDSIKTHVSDLFTKKLKSDNELSALKVLATTNGRMFHLEFLKKLRKELKDAKIKAWVMASPQIQGELSRTVRGLYSYKQA